MKKAKGWKRTKDEVPSGSRDERDFAFDLKRKQWTTKATRTAGALLANLMAKRGFGEIQARGLDERHWQEAVGSEWAGDTRLGALKSGVLEVFVRHAIAIHELNFRKAEIIQNLKRLNPQKPIKNIRFKLDAVD